MKLADLAQHALVDQAPCLGHGGQEACPHRLHAEHACGMRGISDVLCISHVSSQGLFAEHGFSGPYGSKRMRLVNGVGRGDIDGVDLAGLQHHFDVGKTQGFAACGCCEALGLVQIARADCAKRRTWCSGEGIGKARGNAAKPDDPPADRSCRHHSLQQTWRCASTTRRGDESLACAATRSRSHPFFCGTL